MNSFLWRVSSHLWRICLQCRRPGFNPWAGKIPRRRKWQPAPVLLPRESHGQRRLSGYSLSSCWVAYSWATSTYSIGERLPWWLSGKESTGQGRRCEFYPWFGTIPWKRKWQSTPVFLPGKFHGQRSQAGCSLWGHRRVGCNLTTK